MCICFVYFFLNSRPPDHIMTEWSAGESPESRAYKGGRPHMCFRYNLFQHQGKISSLRPENQGNYPGCYHEMNTEVVFPIDAFNFKQCDHDDVSVSQL